MRIVIDGRLWSQSGIGRYIRNLVQSLEKLDQSNEYFILHLKKDFEELVYHSGNFKKVLANFGWYGLGEQTKLPKIIKSLNPDLVHFPHFNVPVFYKGKFVVTIHDLIHQHFQTRAATTHNPLFYQIKKIGYKKVFSHAVSSAEKIITPSAFTKKQLVREWKVKPEKIIVSPEAVEDTMIKLSKKVAVADLQKITDKFNFKKPYFFYVGNAQPHKNLAFLISAFRKIRENFPDLSLVLSGPEHHFWTKIKQDSHVGGLIFTGFVSERELATLYKNAEGLVCPSLEEGFGLPILEAMVCGCPVISSRAGSLPEVGRSAVLYFDPKDENDLISKIKRILEDKALKNKLILNGKKRYREFSWPKLAEQTLRVYRQSI